MFMMGVLCTVCGAQVYFNFRIFMPPPPSKKEGHIALHMLVGMSVGRYVGIP